MKLPRRIKLDIDQEYYNLIPAQQGDTARVLNFQILNNNIPFSLENKTVRARIKKPDGNVCYNDMEIINASEGKCDLKLTNQILIKPGMCKVQLEIMENGEILSTIIFAIFIRESIDIKDAAESTNEFTALENGIIKLDEWDKYFKETSGAIEEKYTERLNGIDSSLEEKVNKEQGKGLSTNDYSDDEQAKVSTIINKADVSYVDSVASTKRDNSTSIKMVDLDTEVKKAMTGGSVAVIDEDAVGPENVKSEAILASKRTATGDYALVIGNDDVNFDFVKNVAKFSSGGATHRIMYRNQVYTIPAETIVDLSLEAPTKSAKLYFNTKTNLIKKYSWAGTSGIPEEEILIGAYSLVDNGIPKVFFSGNNIINGVKPIDIEGGYFERGISFNAESKSIKISPQKLIYGENYYTIESELNLNYSTTGGYGKILVFNVMNKTIYIKSDSILRTYEIILAYWRAGEENCATVNGCFTVDGLVNEIGSNYFLCYKPINFDMVNKRMNFNVDSNNKCILFYNNGTYDIPIASNEVDFNISDTSIVKIYFDISTSAFKATKWNSKPIDGKNILIATVKFTEPYSVQINAQYTINNRTPCALVDEYVQGNKILNSLEDCINSWWVYPLAYRYKGMRDNTYVGYTTSEGYSGVASINNKDGKVIKKHLKKGMVDDHNGVSVMAMPDGKVLTAYCGHNEDKFAHIKISKKREYIDDFEDEILIQFPATTSYTQLFYKDNRYHLFTRVSGGEWMWMYTSSADGRVWATPKKLLKSSLQYYLKVTDTTHPNVLKLVMYSNPQAADTNIRLGYFNIKTGEILNADYSTLLGNINEDIGVSKDNFTIVVPKGDKTLRLLDVAITGTSKTIIAYAEFTTKDDVVYKVATYEGSNTTYSNSINAGQPFYVPSTYVGGVIFLDENTLIVSREENGLWYVEKWISSDGKIYSKTLEIEKTISGITATRPFKVVNTESELLYSLGEYNNEDYTKFYTDLVKV